MGDHRLHVLDKTVYRCYSQTAYLEMFIAWNINKQIA